MSARILLVDSAETVRRVARRHLEEVGHQVEEAASPDEALDVVQRFVPDLILLDPDIAVVPGGMDARGFCRMLRSIANLQRTPLLLMASHSAAERSETLGARDAIRKPFGRDALLTAVAHSLVDTEDTDAFEMPAPEDPAPAAAAIIGLLMGWIGELVPDAAAALERTLQQVPHEELFDSVEALARKLPSHEGTGELSFQGRLEHVGLGDVLQILQHQAQSGVLLVRSFDGRAVSICVRRGHVDLVMAQGTSPELRIGRYLVSEGLLDTNELERLLSGPEQPLLGRRLVQMGTLTEDDLKQALAQQSSELVYEALRWPRGTFSFARYATRPEAEDASLELPMTALLMEGLRRVDEWRLIEEQLDSFDRVPLLDVDVLREMPRERMRPAERTVLDAVDGRRDVRDIIAETKLGAFEVCKILYQLLGSRLVRLR